MIERGRRMVSGPLTDLVGSFEGADTKGPVAAPTADPYPPRPPGGGRERLAAGDPERGHALLPAHQPALRAAAHGADLEQGVRGVGGDPRGRCDGRGAAGSAAPPRPPREHPGEQLPDALARRPGAGAPAGFLRRRTPNQGRLPKRRPPGQRHARRARISAPSVRTRRAHPGTHPPRPIRPKPSPLRRHPITRERGTFSTPIDTRLGSQECHVFKSHFCPLFETH